MHSAASFTGAGEREGVDPAAVRQKLWQRFRRQAICGADVLRPKPGRLCPAVALFLRTAARCSPAERRRARPSARRAAAPRRFRRMRPLRRPYPQPCTRAPQHRMLRHRGKNDVTLPLYPITTSPCAAVAAVSLAFCCAKPFSGPSRVKTTSAAAARPVANPPQ